MSRCEDCRFYALTPYSRHEPQWGECSIEDRLDAYGNEHSVDISEFGLSEDCPLYEPIPDSYNEDY